MPETCSPNRSERIARFVAGDDGVTFLAYFLLSSGQNPQIAQHRQ